MLEIFYEIYFNLKSPELWFVGIDNNKTLPSFRWIYSLPLIYIPNNISKITLKSIETG